MVLDGVQLAQQAVDDQIMRNLLNFTALREIRLARMRGIQDLYVFNVQRLRTLEVRQLRELTYINVINCPLLASACVAECALDDFFVQNCPTLESLDLSRNRFRDVPEVVFDVLGLRELFLSENSIEVIGGGVARLQRLETLDVGQNLLRELPAALGQCRRLQRLNVAGNAVTRPGPQVLRRSVEDVLRFLRGE